MRQLTQSFLGTTWALFLLGTREAGLLAAAPVSGPAARAAGESLDTVTWRTRGVLGPVFGEIFQAGDALQRDALDLTWSSLPENLLDPGAWLVGGAELAETAGMTARRYLVPGRDAGLAWRELGNKLEVYRLVKQVRDRIGVPGLQEPFDPELLLRRSYDLGEYAALWAVEGLGHDWMEHRWQGAEPPRDLLSGPAGRSLPPESLTMLHAGIGLGFAQRLLTALPREPGAADLRRAVERITTLSRENSRPGYEGAALESLGLVTRSFHAPLVPGVDAVLRESDPEARDYFWHGVGRALYFLPINFVPCGRVTWRPFEMGDHAAPDEAAHRNVLAGLGWAFALVNMRQPEIVSRLLLARHGGALAEGDGFANGVASAVMMRRDTTPGGTLLETFLAHRPHADGASWWESLVRRPAETALERLYPGLERRGVLGEIFRYRSFSQLESAAREGRERP